MAYTPPQKILQNYADVLVNFALNHGKGINKGDVVRVTAWESGKPLYAELRKAVLRAGGHPLGRYLPDDTEPYNISRDFYELANDAQLDFFPAKFLRGTVDQIDHEVQVISDTNKRALEGVNPKKIMRSGLAMKPYMNWRTKKENAGKQSWTLALYGTAEMAAEARLTERQYWNQIIKACFLDEQNPIAKWKRVNSQIGQFITKLNALPIKKLHVEGADADLWIELGERRKWLGGRGANIPSFEIFTSPDWRGTNGWIKFNQPLYRYGNLVEGIRLEFTDGLVTKAKATKNQKVLKEMIATENADKVGEFSLTDARFSRITKFMGETLYDENIGGKYGNTHIAVGRSYYETYRGNPAKVTKAQWKRLGYNDSTVHTDMISTANRTVTAHLPGGKKKVIYRDGRFTL